MSPQVFLSYAHDDRFEAEIVAEAMQQQNLAAWSEAAIDAAGGSIADQIRDALKNSSAVVVILTEHSTNNQWVEFEVGAAISLGIPVIPLLVSGSEASVLPDWSNDLQYVDARDRSPQEAVEAVAESLQRQRRAG